MLNDAIVAVADTPTHPTVAGFDYRFNQSAMSEDSRGLMRRVFFLFSSIKWLITWSLFIIYFVFYLFLFIIFSYSPPCLQDELSKATGLLYTL